MIDVRMALAAPLLLLAACGQDAPKPVQPTTDAETLSPGQYEVTAKVASVVSTDKTTPATKLKAGDSATATGCVGEDHLPAPSLFVDDPADVCKIDNSYVKSAILNLALTCTRKRDPGFVSQSIAGSFTADGFTAQVKTNTSFVGTGDYAMVRQLTAKRTGTCPPKATAKP